MNHTTRPPMPPGTPPVESPRQLMLKEVFRDTLLTGVLVLIIFLVTNGGSVIFQALSMLPMFSFLSAGMTTFLSSYAVCILGDIIAILVGLAIFYRKLPKTGWFSRPLGETKFFWLSIFGVVGAASVGVQILNTFYLPFYYAGFEMTEEMLTIPRDDPLAAVLVGLYICVIGPILEEILFRGVILRALEPHGAITASLFSAFLFTIFHFNPLQLFTPLLMGVLAAFIVLRTHSLWPVIVAHILNNTLAMLPEFFFDPSTEAYTVFGGMINTAVSVVTIILLVIFVYYYGKQFTRMCHDEPRITGISVGAKLKKAFVNPITILLLVFYVLSSILIFTYFFA